MKPLRAIAASLSLAGLVLALLVHAPPAVAQGLGSWVSPGELTWDHKDIDTITSCPQCHAPGRGPTPDRCMACHDSVKKQVTSRVGFHKTRGTGCEVCHKEHQGRDWVLIPDLSRDPTFNHFKDVGWRLEGEHDRISCISCHTKPRVYKGLSKECASCHDDPHGKDASKRDLLQDCDACHDAVDWDALPLPADVFDHASAQDADYLLEGQHVEVACDGCHFEAKFVPIPYDACTSCHENPHRADFRTQKCEDCHPNSQTWEVDDFDHDKTRYRLQGEHRKVTCEECHPRSMTEPIAFQKCDTCHFDLHHGQFKPRPCNDCHTVQVAAFARRDWNHDETDYPLVGKHKEQTCEACHGDREKAKYVDLAHDDCDSCHEDTHAGAYEPTKCATCHISEGFEINAFDHNKTAFPHEGKHIGLACEKCHVPGKWNGIDHDSCLDCHYTKNPHKDTITADRCDSCHDEKGFEQVTFAHAEETGFDLAPAHDEFECVECHTQVYDFVGLDATCTACHADDRPWGHYDGDCGNCHEAENWFPAGLGDNEHTITGFALVGAHSLEPCESCHAVGLPRGDAEPDCVACHLHDDPHQNLLGMACADCHTEMSWLRTSWRHTTTGWPLRGTHRLAACADCHATGYTGTPTECFRCHEAEAAQCTTPCCAIAHASTNFASCDDCHRVYAWRPVPATSFPHCPN